MDNYLSALRASHDRLAALLSPMREEQAAAPSYDSEWSIAQVASHLGSGAEIFALFVRAGIEGTEPPGPNAFEPIWDRWNAKSAAEQARDVSAADRAFTDLIDVMSPEARTAWALDMFGQHRDLRTVLGMRLSEHAVHTWDIAVALDPAATVATDAVELIIDGGGLAMLAGLVGKPVEPATEVAVTTTEPARAFRLSLGGDGTALVSAPGDAGGATLALPAEAFVRLVYGRLDPEHTPADVTASGVDLDTLRAAFPGV